MYNLHINLPPPLSQKAKRTRNRARALEADTIRMNNQRREEAKLHGTSFNRINRRKIAVKSLTYITDHFDQRMKDLTKQYQNAYSEFIRKRYHQAMIDLCSELPDRTKRHRNNIRQNSTIPLGVPEDTSDATIELELRPKKRRLPFATNTYLLSQNIYHRLK
ncbi:unnamed protein product [Rhizophagus irregularis]|nr:unnamed protein product [Rhizophagus irregularis]